ncbi:hypothetical protein ACH5RR_033121 [Cinchona calisaya]|uniref:Uncharacterized protein n=1 Tax=Cinchona calisaya TaxID=153742 RepID=A0ABD2YPE1_9GENT
MTFCYFTKYLLYGCTHLKLLTPVLNIPPTLLVTLPKLFIILHFLKDALCCNHFWILKKSGFSLTFNFLSTFTAIPFLAWLKRLNFLSFSFVPWFCNCAGK